MCVNVRLAISLAALNEGSEMLAAAADQDPVLLNAAGGCCSA